MHVSFPNGEPDIQSEPISIINAQPTPPLLMLDWLNRCGGLFFNENTTVQMPQYSMLGFDDSMTIEMWVTYQGNVNGGTTQFLIGQGNDTDIAFRLMLTADGLFELFTHDGRQFSSSVELPLQNGEHHVALVYQHPTWQLYLDGILVLNNTSTGDPLPDSDEMPLFIGAAGSGQEFSRFNGGFHSIRASHQARYTEPFFNLIDTLIFRPQMDDAALWYFAPAPSEGDFTVPDLSGNGNNLEVSAGTWYESCPIPIFDLRCLIEEESDDIDNDPLTYGFSWTLDDEPLETASFQYPMAEEIYQEHLIGVETVTCKVIASDGQPSENSQSEPVEVQMSLQQQ